MENTKTVRAEQFARILQKALVRYGVCLPNQWIVTKLDYTIASMKGVIATRISDEMHITEQSILSERLIRNVIENYKKSEREQRLKSNYYYNATRRAAWEATYEAAFYGRPMPAPQYITIDRMKREFSCRLYGCPVSSKSDEFMRFPELRKEATAKQPTDYRVTFDDLQKMHETTTSASEKAVLKDMLKAHFLADKMEYNVEVVNAKDIEVVARYESQNEAVKNAVEAVSDEYLKLTDKVIQGVVMQLTAISKSKAVDFDEEDIEAILTAIGVQAELVSLRREVQELTATNKELRDKLDSNCEVFGKLKDILGHASREVKSLHGVIDATEEPKSA